MAFCLPKEFATKFTNALRDGKIVPEKLAAMTSAERREFFSNIVGEGEAKEVNALFESKLLLKNYKNGLVTWAKQLAGLKPEVKRDMVSSIEKLSNILSPEDEQKFLADLAEKKLGTSVTFDEAKQISDLAKSASDARAAVKDSDPIGSDSRLDYGAKFVELQNYVSELKRTTDSTLRDEFKKAPISTTLRQATKIFSLSKALKNVGDLSSLLHQGMKALTTHPLIWSKNALLAVTDAARSLGRSGTDTEIADGIKADIYSRPNALNGTYQKMGIEIGNTEEALPSTLPEKVPLFGRIYKATETGFTGFLYRTRADLADLYVDMMKDNGVDMSDRKQLSAVGNMVNALTGRGKTSSVTGDTNFINAAIYSQKMLKSNIDFLTAHQFQKDVTPFVRKTAALNLLKSVVATAGILATASALVPGSVTWDPRSTNFGKIKIGPVSFDVTGGVGSVIVLAARLYENSTITSKGKVEPLNTGKYGAPTSQSVIADYLSGKLSPAASVVLDLLDRSTWNGSPLSLSGEVENGILPFPVQNYLQGTQAGLSPADSLLSEIADSLGLFETLPSTPVKK